MKRFVLILGLFVIINSLNAQDTTKVKEQDIVSYGKLDSLIQEKTKNYLDKTTIISGEKTRGLNQDPCDADMQNLKNAFANLKQAYINCCKNQNSDVAVLRALAHIYLITSNPNCSWGLKQYAYLAYYWNDYSTLKNNLNCTYCNGN